MKHILALKQLQAEKDAALDALATYLEGRWQQRAILAETAINNALQLLPDIPHQYSEWSHIFRITEDQWGAIQEARLELSRVSNAEKLDFSGESDK